MDCQSLVLLVLFSFKLNGDLLFVWNPFAVDAARARSPRPIAFKLLLVGSHRHLAINTKHLAAITLNRELANPLFLSYSIHSSPFILNQFKSKNRGAIMSGLNLGLIKETKLKRPPVSLQNDFAKIHQKIDEIKFHYRQSLTDLETLYGALSQQAFKGELDLSRVPMPDVQVVRGQSK